MPGNRTFVKGAEAVARALGGSCSITSLALSSACGGYWHWCCVDELLARACACLVRVCLRAPENNTGAKGATALAAAIASRSAQLATLSLASALFRPPPPQASGSGLLVRVTQERAAEYVGAQTAASATALARALKARNGITALDISSECLLLVVVAVVCVCVCAVSV